jgi:hypothetical protein
MRLLFTLVSVLSLLLSLAAAGMWARSLDVTEAWHLAPRPTGTAPLRYRFRAWESANGRLAYVEYEFHGWPPGFVSPGGGYARTYAPLSPTRHGWAFSRPPVSTVSGRIPGVAEWWDSPGAPYNGNAIGMMRVTTGQQRLIFVPWRTVVLTGTVLPLIWAWRRWRGRHRGSAFPVLPPTT